MQQNLLLMTDSYKFTHWRQYPPGTERVYSYIESRGGMFAETVFFGLQYYLKRLSPGRSLHPGRHRRGRRVLPRTLSGTRHTSTARAGCGSTSRGAVGCRWRSRRSPKAQWFLCPTPSSRWTAPSSRVGPVSEGSWLGTLRTWCRLALCVSGISRSCSA